MVAEVLDAFRYEVLRGANKFAGSKFRLADWRRHLEEFPYCYDALDKPFVVHCGAAAM